jgi:hypothetical protein
MSGMRVLLLDLGFLWGVGGLVRFTLIRSQWYGLTMFPGYGDCPYHSPIQVHEIEALGDRQFKLAFFNLCYASGVQHFEKQLRTLRRGVSHLVAAETEVEDRTYVLVYFNAAWFQRYFPDSRIETIFDSAGQPNKDALLRWRGA